MCRISKIFTKERYCGTVCDCPTLEGFPDKHMVSGLLLRPPEHSLLRTKANWVPPLPPGQNSDFPLSAEALDKSQSISSSSAW